MSSDERGDELGTGAPDYGLEEPDPGSEAEDVEFDVTSGEDLVDELPDPSEAPAELRQSFWAIVLLLDVGFFAVVVGPLLAYSWGWTSRGGALFLVGVVALVHAAIRIRRFQRS